MAALTEKNEQLSYKVEGLMRRRGDPSNFDSKVIYGKADKLLAKTRLIDEVNELVMQTYKKMSLVTDGGLKTV